jgi:hypothetical protein
LWKIAIKVLNQVIVVLHVRGIGIHLTSSLRSDEIDRFQKEFWILFF